MRIAHKIVLIGLLASSLCWFALAGYTQQELTTPAILCFMLVTGMVFILMRQFRRKKMAVSEISTGKAQESILPGDLHRAGFTTDLSGDFTFISNEVTSLTGYAPKELMHKNVSFLATPPFEKLVSDHFKRQHLTRRPESTIYFPILTRAGEHRWIEQLSVLTHAGGKLSGFECVIKNIGADKQDADSLKPSPEIRRRYIAIPSSNADQWGVSKGSWRLPFAEQSLARLLGLNQQ